LILSGTPFEIIWAAIILKSTDMVLTILLLLAGIIGFAIFFKSIDFFDKI